jgi:hypothetical protein
MAVCVLIIAFEELAMEMLTRDASEQLSRALGDAVIRMWGDLPPQLQNRLFKEAISAHDRRLRPRLAVLLHDKHPRTSSARKARAILEPDSLGG